MRAKAIGAYLLFVNGRTDGESEVEKLVCPKCGELMLTEDEASFLEELPFYSRGPVFVDKCDCKDDGAQIDAIYEREKDRREQAADAVVQELNDLGTIRGRDEDAK